MRILCKYECLMSYFLHYVQLFEQISDFFNDL
nr:MAG TPA: hypothetical protein [Caudoviricetes sp.]